MLAKRAHRFDALACFGIATAHLIGNAKSNRITTARPLPTRNIYEVDPLHFCIVALWEKEGKPHKIRWGAKVAK